MKGRAILTRNRIITTVIVAILVLFLGYQWYASVFLAITTESAERFDYTESVDTTATFIRNEVTVENNKQGTIHFLVASGEKVATNGTIANIYSSSAASAAAARIAEIDKQLGIIQEIEGYNNSTAVDMGTINDRINLYLNDLIYKSSDGRFYDVGNSSSELLTVMTRKLVATGQTNDFAELKNSLNNEKTELAKQMGSVNDIVTSEKTGYFVSETDGFETVFTTEDLTKYTPEFLSSAKVQTVASNVIGKIVYDYEWYLAAPVGINDSMHYKEGDKVTIKTDTASSPRLSATVVTTNLSESDDSAVIIFRIGEMNSEIATVRSCDIQIIKTEYSGIRVSSKAIRVVDGVTGVYVESGIEAKFVEAEIIYSNEEYKICELNTADSKKLRLYDKIIVKGKNLYDGKIIY